MIVTCQLPVAARFATLPSHWAQSGTACLCLPFYYLPMFVQVGRYLSVSVRRLPFALSCVPTTALLLLLGKLLVGSSTSICISTDISINISISRNVPRPVCPKPM
ncbi:hypothetical protein LZ30DRAFT_178095 [Colletotrichum cereale]|nr:hypothetical protein LZ30DRAFT_178095 [Colletotrichum cereale]